MKRKLSIKDAIMKKRKERKEKIDVVFDEVAIPEVVVHSGEDDRELPFENDKEDAPVEYENLAVPEIHVKHNPDK